MFNVRVWFCCLGLVSAVACSNTSGEDAAPIEPSVPSPPASELPPNAPPQTAETTPPNDEPAADPPGKPSPRPGIGDGEDRGSGPASGSGTLPSLPSASPASAPGASPASTPVPPPSSSSGAADVSSGAAGAPASSPPGVDGGDVPSGRPAQSGVLTAGTWDDNRNIDRFDDYRAKVAQERQSGVLNVGADEIERAHTAFGGVQAARQTLDIAMVIDTTGSMGDEISYLQTEFLAISRTIEDKYPDAEQRWSLVVYRDDGDEYVTRWFDFRDDANDFREKLAQQSAGGGGDFPEAPHAALSAMAQLAWRTDESTARLAFWVADAPHHDNQATEMLEAIRAARELGVHVYPVASSGIDDFTELTMRTTAQLTGGRYIFLTDDSGVGGAHKEPSIPCYFVTRLDKAMLRMVDIELTGTYREPESADIIRTGGEPKNGACELQSGEVLEVF